MRSRLVLFIAALFIAALSIVAGCGPASAPTAVLPTTLITLEPGESDVPMPSSPPIDDLQLAATTQLAVDDLATRLGRETLEIEVVSAARVTWPDGSLGCPQPGMMYTQALVEGFQVILGIDGRTRVFAYHAGTDGVPFLCPSTEPDGGHDFIPPPGVPY